MSLDVQDNQIKLDSRIYIIVMKILVSSPQLNQTYQSTCDIEIKVDHVQN